MESLRGRVVVGYDGSDASRDAARWAIDAARLRGRSVVLVQALLPPVSTGGLGVGLPLDVGLVEQLEIAAHEALTAAAEELRSSLASTAAPPMIETAVPIGSPSSVLREASEVADMIVIGSRGHGGFAGLLLGSVGAQVAAHADCPVVVIRHLPADTASTIVVGIDGSPAAEPALRFAFDEASRRGCSVTAVHAWDVPAYDLLIVPNGPVPVPLADVADDEVRLTAEALSGFRDEYPDVDVIESLVRAPAVMALLAASTHAAMVVVGTHGHGPAMGALLGSVSNGLLHKAAVPVVVVPHAPDRGVAA